MTPSQDAVPLPPLAEAYDTRLVTRIPQTLDQRLRLMAVLNRKPITHVLSELLARALPTADELAAQLQRKGRPDER